VERTCFKVTMRNISERLLSYELFVAQPHYPAFVMPHFWQGLQ
jgi:hypothetical protein